MSETDSRKKARRTIAWVVIGLAMVAMLVLAVVAGTTSEEGAPPSASAVAADASPTAAPTATPAPSPTSTPAPTAKPTAVPPLPPTATTAALADSDGDYLPDDVERQMGYDPFVNECAEAAGSVMNVLILVDNSTAMAGDIPGGKKVELIQGAIAQYTAALPVGVNSGLVAYGSAGCEVPQPLVPVRAVNPKSFAATAKTITTGGQAPLAATLGRAEKIFGQRPGQSNRIMLMAAGPDSCQGDPCAAASQLKQGSLGVTIDVIGVGVDQAARSKLECIASGSGGLYYDAPGVDDLRKAWDIQARKVEQIAASAGNARERVARYRQCLSERREKFREWAKSTGWADQHRPDFERIINDLQEEGFRVQ